MASSFRPPNLSGDDVQETLEKEKGEADDIELVGERSDSSSEIDTPPSNHCPRLPSTDLDNHVTNVSGGGSYQLQTPMPTAAGANQSTLDDVEASSSEESIYQSVRSDTPTNPVKIYGMGTDDLPVDPFDSRDLARSIPGLYRILELVTEQGSGGLVDKIIISQNSLKEFINTISPGAYASMTKVNFNMLDQCVVKPVGIYGSKEEIVRFLLTLHVADDTIATHLLSEPHVTEAHPTLRSGLYILRTTTDKPNGSEQIYVIHWPEQNTWDDSAPSQVRRNRVAFMRYLTRMCDQIVALVSPDHAGRMVWNELGEDDEDDEGDRIIKCVVQRTTEQEESVQVREGFKIVSPHISQGEPSECGEQCSMKPFLLLGETAQGFMTVQHQPSRRAVELFEGRLFSEIQLQNYLTSDSLYLSEALNGRGLQILVHVGLEKRFSQECAEWKHQSKAIRERYKKIFDDRFRTARDELAKLAESLNSAVRNAVIDAVVALYPFVDKQALQYTGTCTEDPPVSFSQIVDAHPEADGLFQHNIQEYSVISDPEFRVMKEQLCLVVELMPRTKHLDSKIRDPIWQAARHGGFQEAQSTTKSLSANSPGMLKMLSDFWQKLKKSFVNPQTDTPSIECILEEAQEAALKVTDSEFFRIVAEKKRVQRSPPLAQLAEKARLKAKSYLQRTMPHVVRKVVWSIREVQEKNCHAHIKTECYNQEDQEQSKLRVQLIRLVNNLSTQVQSRHTLRINSVEEEKKHQLGPAKTYKLWGQQESQEDPVTCYTVHSMDLMKEDKQNSKLDPSSIPSPRFCLQSEFQLPLGHTILRAQLLEGQRLLLIVADRFGDISVYLETLAAMYGAIQQKRCKLLKRERIGRDIHLAFDESKRMLGIVSSDKLLLHVLEYDDSQRLKAKRSAISLNPWYGEGVFIHHACFICGSEEILLVDSQAQARVFSLAVMQLRPAVLNLPQVPTSVHCTADGSCILVIHSNESELAITAYHWNSFGSTEGIALNIPDLSVGEPLVVTSLIKRTAVHLLKLDLPTRCCQSYALDITRRHTELMFRERANRRPTPEKAHKTAHNCLIDCHSDVWTRFPVLAAVQRETISSASLRSRRTLVFVTDRDFDMFAPHFSQMIQSFERTIKKPTGNFLDSVKVSAAPFNVFAQELCDGTTWNVSQYRAGEWIVEFLCLIPIHIAVTKDNCFIPLKDGVYSPSLERELLGAGINRIVDSISFGWYESLFQSYMATKPVRVVSSMGEQSVGKSYALNHLVDTSFAGSAMRTTEGVWMSVTPTEKELIVALDFEGVHSIERSVQEDTLLVLFNTAISNLVLFRNNFALNRDITGLFQSFQSSATVLDPTENPSLFQSTLVIIIKDAGEADKAEIGREFSLKFEKIVQDEQEANFITRLHAGRLNIIPWPVIESNEFYKLFTKVKQCLDQQPVTHPSAGEFLHKMKTLMAKLKANDWGAMSQTMASHRAQLLLSWLPNALIYGLQEIDPEPEPLKNVDTDIPIQFPDTQLQLFLTAGLYSQSDTREQTLTVLRNSWHQHEMRQHLPDPQWADSLSQYLERIVSMRIDHVREWLTQNLSRFQRRHASIEELRRTFDDATVDLRSNVQLCRLQCADCQLLCVQSRLHDGPHNCRTDHVCIHQCDFCKEDTGDRRACSMIGGHAGKHICVVNAHLCGQPCTFAGKFGCLDQCTKVTDHLDEHICAALVHGCGEPCDLSGIKLIDGSTYACPGTCRIPSDVAHARHRCEARLCSITCQLCKRLCSHHDHMHGLEEGAIHLCGEEHLCSADCSVPGICEIETAPYSIEATFTGRHETFQYTKYSQVARRLKCVKSIPPGQTKHNGLHNHSLDRKVVHFCENRCENCGYFCILPLGHPQKEHETRHGSMSHTRWVVDEPDDAAALEVEGRKFSTDDEGAPMMCNLFCQAMGRHVHIDYCPADDTAACTGREDIQHIAKRLLPDPDRPKDYITHSLFWKKSGFKDPYSKEEQADFAKCDAMCRGPEHAGDAGVLPQPSYCTLPMFHPPLDLHGAAPAIGYVSNDGHQFTCRNPVVMQNAYHVIFVADCSGSMSFEDKRPLPNTPASERISAHSNNRFGAVLSSLYGFWYARSATIGSSPSASRRDAYSVILFDSHVMPVIENDFTSNPDQLLDAVLPYTASGGTNFTAAIAEAAGIMERHWSTERSPVIIFLSDGECQIADQTMQGLCRTSIQLGQAVSFHAVLFSGDSQIAGSSNIYHTFFGRQHATSTCLHRMVEIAQDAQNNAPTDPLAPTAMTVMSSYTDVLDTVQLAETFLGIAESLEKPRGSLMPLNNRRT